MFDFEHHLPTKIIFGASNVEKVGKEVGDIGKKVLMIIGQKSAEETGTLEKCISLIEKEGVQIEVYKGITTNPLESVIEKGVKIAKSFEPEAIITIGGGSVHDAGKAISLMATHEGNLHEYVHMGKKRNRDISNVTIPLITVPTVSGTGAEISPATIIKIKNKKEIIVSSYLFPKVSIIDPALQVSVPPKATAQVGIDAFIQGLEAFVSKNAQPFSDGFAIAAMKHSITHLPQAVKNPKNLEARNFVALAAIESMFAITQAGVGAIHALSDPLSSYYNIPHGLALSILASKVIAVNLDSNEERFAEIPKLFGVDMRKMTREEAAKKSIVCIESFLADIGLYPLPSLRNFGTNRQDLDLLVNGAKNPDMVSNPKELTDEEIMSIFMESL
ncbi:MAG: iron-containing alcohol dehydrogenase [Nitrospiraceae bacterium]|nr:iron-containing alcohol dehydrogenase [Nitrospiraceae bacterium]